MRRHATAKDVCCSGRDKVGSIRAREDSCVIGVAQVEQRTAVALLDGGVALQRLVDRGAPLSLATRKVGVTRPGLWIVEEESDPSWDSTNTTDPSWPAGANIQTSTSSCTFDVAFLPATSCFTLL